MYGFRYRIRLPLCHSLCLSCVGLPVLECRMQPVFCYHCLIFAPQHCFLAFFIIALWTGALCRFMHFTFMYLYFCKNAIYWKLHICYYICCKKPHAFFSLSQYGVQNILYFHPIFFPSPLLFCLPCPHLSCPIGSNEYPVKPQSCRRCQIVIS